MVEEHLEAHASEWAVRLGAGESAGAGHWLGALRAVDVRPRRPTYRLRSSLAARLVVLVGAGEPARAMNADEFSGAGCELWTGNVSRMTRSFGLDAASALKALKTASERFQNDDLNEDLA